MQELQYVVTDGHVSSFIVGRDGMKPRYFEALTLSWEEFYGFLHTHAQLITTVESEEFGPIRIYKIDWST